MSRAFDITCRAWKVRSASSLPILPSFTLPLFPQDRFDVQYTHCGCPLPGETIGQKLSHLVGFIETQHLSSLVLPERDDLLTATHPSDHNTAFAFHHKGRSMAAHCNDRYNHVIRHRINTHPYGLDPILRNHMTFPAHIPEPVRSRPVPRSRFAVLRSCGALRQTRVPA